MSEVIFRKMFPQTAALIGETLSSNRTKFNPSRNLCADFLQLTSSP